MDNRELDLGAIKRAAKSQLSQIPGVEGFGIGDHSLNIYIHDADVKNQLPSEFQGVQVNCVVTGEISAGS